jgi:uncharacterized protein (TIGR03435 family)
MQCGIVLALLTAATSFAQQPVANPAVAFETAAIHPAKLTNGCFSKLPPGGTQYALSCVTLKNLIAIAYNSDHIEGGGPALDAYYDLRATVPGDKPWTNESVAPMMKQFLIERFHLAVHPGKRELPGYALVLARSGGKLHSAEPDRAAQGQKAGESSANFVAPGYIQGRSIDSKSIAGLLSLALHVPVADHTGLTGIYNVDLRYAPDSLSNGSPENESDSNLPSFFTALEEQLGLKLQPQKVDVDTVVVDHVDLEPAPN